MMDEINGAINMALTRIMMDREKYLEAFIAETGLPPSQVMQVEEIYGNCRHYYARRRKDIEGFETRIADLEQENARLCEVEKELTKEKKLSDDLYLLLVDNPS
ncbi:MAG: hypothetical protein ABFD50_02310, partial [Smithella sp.]